jgi:hypothetical protein
MSSKLLRRAYLANAFFPILLLTGGAASAADEVFRPTTAITLPAGQTILSFDISFVDPLVGLYVLGDRTNKAVDVIDTDTNTVLVQLGKGSFKGATGDNDTSGPDGVLIVRHREVWAGDGDSTFKVIDLFSQQITHTVSTGGTKRVDEMCHDPRDHLVMMANNAETPFPFASLVSTKTYAIVKKITFDGTGGTPKAVNGAEQCQWNHRTGKFYIALPEIDGTGGAGGVAVIDPKTMAVEATFVVPLASCQAPQGMAIGPDHQILLGCNGAGGADHPTAIIDERNGKVIRTLKNQSGADMVWFNPGDGHYFLARSSAVGSNQLFGVVDSDGIRQDQSVPITLTPGTPNAHSVAADPVMNQVYVPIPGGGKSNVCSTAGGSDAQGCIAVFTTPNDDRPERTADRRGDRRQ